MNSEFFLALDEIDILSGHFQHICQNAKLLSVFIHNLCAYYIGNEKRQYCRNSCGYFSLPILP